MNSQPDFFDKLYESFQTSFVDFRGGDLTMNDMVIVLIISVLWAMLSERWELSHLRALRERQPPMTDEAISHEMKWMRWGVLAMLFIAGVALVLYRSWPT